jgi:hypothetical protein
MPTKTATPSKPAMLPVKKSEKKGPPANLFTGIGRLGQEPQLRYSDEGRAWCKTSLAIFQGEDKEPIWLQVKAFAKPLDKGGWDESVPVALAGLKKGQKVNVRGKLFCDKRDYKDKQYIDWGLVLYGAPIVIVDDAKNAAAGDEPD